MSRLNYGRPFVVTLVLALTTLAQGAGERPPQDADEALLAKAGVSTSDQDLLNFLKTRSSADADLAQPDKLVAKLRSEDFAERQSASKRLATLGRASLPVLNTAAKDSDVEVASRAKACIEEINKDRRLELSMVRLLGRRAPAGAAAALLAFVPYAVDEHLEETVWFTLDSLVRREGQIDDSFETALSARLFGRRAAAGFVLVRYGSERQRARANQLLEDAHPWVRLRVAQGLLGLGETKGVPTLIQLLGDKELSLAWQAEELLRWTAGARAPRETIGAGLPEAREGCRKAWEAWWQRDGEALNLRKREENWQRPGLVVLCSPGRGWEEGRVWLCGCDGTPRCVWGGLRSSVEARLLPGPRVLVVEAPFLFLPDPPPEIEPVRGRVTERNPSGKVSWECEQFPDPVGCCQLLNGNTLIAAREGEGGEVMPNGHLAALFGKEIFRAEPLLQRGKFFGVTAEGRLLLCVGGSGDGQFGYVTELDPVLGRVNGAEFSYTKPRICFSVEEVGIGSYLISGTESGEVFEVTTTPRARNGKPISKKVWETTLPESTHAVKLPSGHILVAAEGRVATLDRAAKTVGELLCPWTPHRVRPCLGLVRLGFETPPSLDGNFDVLIAHRLRGLKSENPLVRWRSVEFLGDLGPKGAEAIPALTDALTDPDDGVKNTAKASLKKVGSEELPKLLKDMKAPDPEIRAKATGELWRYPRVPALLLPALAVALKDQDWRVRDRAAGVLGAFELGAGKAAGLLAEAIQDDHKDVRRQAALALGRLRQNAKVAVPALLQALKGTDVELPHTVAAAIGMIGPVDEAIIPALVDTLKNDHARGSAALALAVIGPEAKKAAVPVLVEWLGKISQRAPSEGLEHHNLNCVISAVGRFGEDAKGALPDLLRIIDTNGFSDEIKYNAAIALGRIGPNGNQTVLVMIRLLETKGNCEGCKKEAIRVLGQIGSSAVEAIPVLEKRLAERNDDIADLAFDALEQIRGKR